MLFSKSIALAMLAAGVSADEHHLHRREADAAVAYVTIHTTDYVYANGEAASTTAAVSTSPVYSSESTSEATTEAATSEAATSEATSAASVTTSSEYSASSTSSSSAASSTSTSSSSSVGSGGALGITYSPYSNSGGCKSSSEIASELEKLTGFDHIRLYAADCNQVGAVYAAKASNQKLFLGVYDMNAIESEIEEIDSQLGGDWSDVVTVSIGNELVNSGQASTSQVAGYVSTGRSKLESVGYTGPVVSVDTFIAVIDNTDLCSISDYVAINAHAYFDTDTTSSEAGSWALGTIQEVAAACNNGKDVLVVESGWPSAGDTNGKAVASQEDQDTAIQSLKDTVGSDVYLFTAYNDLWKSPGYLDVEQWWGIYGSSSE